MSQGILETPTDLNEPVDPNDRFAYGWRYVQEILPDGTEKWSQVPLTLEDVLHPQEEDFRLLNDPHWQDCFYLGGAFKAALAETPGAHVLGDCRVAWDEAGEYAHGPDIAVIFNVRAYQRWSTFNVVHEGTRPALIVEVTSPSTRSTDLVDKKREYAEEGVPHYIVADARERQGIRRVKFIDYHLPPGGDIYEEKELGESGRIWLDEVNLWLGFESGKLACYDTAGNRIGNYVEVTQALADETRARTTAERKAATAKRQAAQAERQAAKETKARAEAERKRAVAELASAEAERQVALERESRVALEARFLAMEEELRRVRGEKNEGE